MGRIDRNELTTYDACDNRLDGRDKRKLRYAVWLVRDGADITIVHHHTPIIRYRPDGTIVLDCNGHHSCTTKDNLNRYTDFAVWQKDFVWYISDGIEGDKAFTDGMTFAGQPSRAVCEA
jgi:hypothetical protein